MFFKVPTTSQGGWSCLCSKRLCLHLQISDCSSQQIQGLPSLRASLATLNLHRSTESMMVSQSRTWSQNLEPGSRCSRTWTCDLFPPSSPSSSQRPASSRSGNLRGRSLAVLSRHWFPSGDTWPRWTWATTASAPSTTQWWVRVGLVSLTWKLMKPLNLWA